MAMRKITSLSAGIIIRQALMDDAELAGKVTAIFPVWSTSDLTLPYICYIRESMQGQHDKQRTVTDNCNYTISVFAKDYDEAIELIEDVRRCIEGKRISYTEDGVTTVMDCSVVVDCEEAWDLSQSAYEESITINCRIL